MSVLDFMLNLPNTSIRVKEAHILASRMLQLKSLIGPFSSENASLVSSWVYYTLGSLRHDIFLKRRVLMMRSADMDSESIRIGVKSMPAVKRLAELLLNAVILTYQDSELIVCFPESSTERFAPPK